MLYALDITTKQGNEVAYTSLSNARRRAKSYAKLHYRDVTIREDFRGPIVAQYDRDGCRLL